MNKLKNIVVFTIIFIVAVSTFWLTFTKLSNYFPNSDSLNRVEVSNIGHHGWTYYGNISDNPKPTEIKIMYNHISDCINLDSNSSKFNFYYEKDSNTYWLRKGDYETQHFVGMSIVFAFSSIITFVISLILIRVLKLSCFNKNITHLKKKFIVEI